MTGTGRAWGAALIAISLLAVVDTIRAGVLEERGRSRYDNRMVSLRRFAFAGHQVALEDDQPTDTVSHQHETPGMLRVMIDGRVVGTPSRVGVRRGVANASRYHSWFQATVFTSRANGDSSLWLARKVRRGRSDSHYEITEINSDGSILSGRGAVIPRPAT
ncbi:MAG: hypothetical protein JWM95_1787 [Gemmatimonadetes bacterium]|nr:hypothetical protein [Gemmatimonadota bacterium]